MNIIDKPVKTKILMPEVPAKDVRHLVEVIKNMDDNDPVTLQFLLVALFPNVWNNIKQYATDCYTNGYIQGLEDAKNENQESDR